MPNVLVLEDQPGWGALLSNAVRNGRLPGCRLAAAETYGEAMQLLGENRFDVGILDYTLERAGPEGRKTGLDVAREMRRACPAAMILLVTMADPYKLMGPCDELGVRLIEKGRPDLEEEIIRELTHKFSTAA